MGAVVALVLLIYLITMSFGLVCYIFQSLGMYRIAKRRGIHNAWLAWVPLGNSWMLGCISDQYRYVARGEVKSKRKVLLSLGLVALVLAVVFLCLMVMMNSFQHGEAEVYPNDYFLEDDFDVQASGTAMPMAAFIGVYLVMIVLSIVSMVVQYMALYDLYQSCDPSSSVLFLLLSIFINVTLPFLVFASRNKDGGMPPRMQQPVVDQTVWQPPQPPKEPWEQ